MNKNLGNKESKQINLKEDETMSKKNEVKNPVKMYQDPNETKVVETKAVEAKVEEKVEEKVSLVKPEKEAIIEPVKEKLIETKDAVKSVNNFEELTKTIDKYIKNNEDLKIVVTENASGNSYFTGKTRLFKLLKSKKGVSLEINVQLAKETSKKFSMEDISIAKAHEKHLGTMKHHYKSSNINDIDTIINEIIVTFKSSIKVKEESKKIDEVTKAV